MDLQGPKIRIGKLPDDEILLIERPAGHIDIPRQIQPTVGEIPVDFTELPGSVHPGGRILLDDGNLELKVMQLNLQYRVHAHVIVGGILKSHKGISLPEAHLDISALDREGLYRSGIWVKTWG